MSNAPEKSRQVSRPHGEKLDSQLAALDRTTEGRQNNKTVPVKLTTPKRPKPR